MYTRIHKHTHPHSNVKKHASEIDKMTNVEHLRLIPLVEAALALMRLSCEKFFVLVSVYVSYLLFQDPPGEVMRFMIRLNARYVVGGEGDGVSIAMCVCMCCTWCGYTCCSHPPKTPTHP